MSPASPSSAAARLDQGPSLLTRIAAVAVVLALAGLAYYAVFSGPTTVAVNTPTKAAQAQEAAPAGEPDSEGPERESEKGG